MVCTLSLGDTQTCQRGSVGNHFLGIEPLYPVSHARRKRSDPSFGAGGRFARISMNSSHHRVQVLGYLGCSLQKDEVFRLASLLNE